MHHRARVGLDKLAQLAGLSQIACGRNDRIGVAFKCEQVFDGSNAFFPAEVQPDVPLIAK
jgi:hypothetical protein